MILAKIDDLYYHTDTTLNNGTKIYLGDVVNWEDLGEYSVDIIYSMDNVNFFILALSGGLGDAGADISISEDYLELISSNGETFPVVKVPNPNPNNEEDMLILAPYVFINKQKIEYGSRVTINNDFDEDSDEILYGLVEALVFNDEGKIIAYVRDDLANNLIKVSVNNVFN